MVFRFLKGILIMAIFTQCSNSGTTSFVIEQATPFAVCYAKVTPAQVKNYELVIVEPDFYSPEEIKSLRASGPKVIAYLTLGEVDENRWYFPKLEGHGFRGKNENWNSYYIDLEKEDVRQTILNEVIPEIAGKGVDGFFLDTIDAVSPETDRGDLQPYMVELIEAIRVKYPDKIIIQNAGLFLLDRTGDDVDAFLTEALASDYDFIDKEYMVRTDEEYNLRLGYLQHYVEENNIPYFILDYAGTPEQVEKIKTRLDTLHRPYFISNIGLSELPPQPDSVANDLKAGRP